MGEWEGSRSWIFKKLIDFFVAAHQAAKLLLAGLGMKLFSLMLSEKLPKKQKDEWNHQSALVRMNENDIVLLSHCMPDGCGKLTLRKTNLEASETLAIWHNGLLRVKKDKLQEGSFVWHACAHFHADRFSFSCCLPKKMLKWHAHFHLLRMTSVCESSGSI